MSMSHILQVAKKTKFTTKYTPAQYVLLNYIIPYIHFFNEEFYKSEYRSVSIWQKAI